MKIIHRITWLDSGAQFHDGWASASESIAGARLSIVVTAGYLFHEDEDTVYLALTYDESNETFYGVQAIAKSCIKKRESAIWFLTEEGNPVL